MATKAPTYKLEITMDENTMNVCSKLIEAMFAGKITQTEAVTQVAEAIVTASPTEIQGQLEMAPVAAPVPVAPVAPVAPVSPVAPVAPVAPVSMPFTAPVAAPTQVETNPLTLDTISRYGAELVAKGVNPQPVLQQFGIVALTQLKPEQYPMFLQALQALAGAV